MNEFSEDKLVQYINDVHKKTSDIRLVDNSVRSDILNRVQEACKITGLQSHDLLRRLDFKPHDKTIEALESFLAELRAIFWLRDSGFLEIVPLLAEKKTKRPDFKAKYKNKDSTIEVFCLTQKHGQQRDRNLGVFVNFDPQFKGSKLGRDFMTAAQRKKKQLDSVSAYIKVLLCVVNSEAVVALNTKKDWGEHAKLLYENLGWGNGYHVGTLAGSDSAIYPNLDL